MAACALRAMPSIHSLVISRCLYHDTSVRRVARRWMDRLDVSARSSTESFALVVRAMWLFPFPSRACAGAGSACLR